MLALPVVDRERRPNTTAIRDLDWYNWFLVNFSGGKESVALALGLGGRASCSVGTTSVTGSLRPSPNSRRWATCSRPRRP
jgi:hypothetical protein